MKKIKVALNSKSIKDAIKEVENYKSDLEKKTIKFNVPLAVKVKRKNFVRFLSKGCNFYLLKYR